MITVLTLTVLAYKRYVQVTSEKLLFFMVWKAICFCWVYSLAWNVVPLLGWNRYTQELHGLQCSLDWVKLIPEIQLYPVVFPLLYQAQKLQTIKGLKILEYEIKMAKTCLLMMLAFLVRWMPNAILSLLMASGHGKLISPTFTIMPSLSALSSTAYSPAIYLFTMKKV
ncbi:hypothetical protein GDO86_001331 [Hymenochirus boettgeri]|uniref:G-protein coupled receptors family 1 profile domain-containing protein n=1 Tax=Hymenochirus boettgeri TaxID=247094 RepID=A0A8T2KI32_9PIPI|nr:hypothetical protein GDO86_001331 [Hymenochirus boettgeri]